MLLPSTAKFHCLLVSLDNFIWPCSYWISVFDFLNGWCCTFGISVHISFNSCFIFTNFFLQMSFTFLESNAISTDCSLFTFYNYRRYKTIFYILDFWRFVELNTLFLSFSTQLSRWYGIALALCLIDALSGFDCFLIPVLCCSIGSEGFLKSCCYLVLLRLVGFFCCFYKILYPQIEFCWPNHAE